jgi:hypothetical protein
LLLYDISIEAIILKNAKTKATTEKIITEILKNLEWRILILYSVGIGLVRYPNRGMIGKNIQANMTHLK